MTADGLFIQLDCPTPLSESQMLVREILDKEKTTAVSPVTRRTEDERCPYHSLSHRTAKNGIVFCVYSPTEMFFIRASLKRSTALVWFAT